MISLLKDTYCERYFLVNRSSINIFYTVNTLVIPQALALNNIPVGVCTTAKYRNINALYIPNKHPVYLNRVFVTGFDHAVSFGGCV